MLISSVNNIFVPAVNDYKGGIQRHKEHICKLFCTPHLSALSLTSVLLLFTEKLLSVNVVVVGCGPHHVAVLSEDGEMYTWGRGDGGRLGLGHEEDWYVL
jgi:hypothetical protein